ncbi:MAG: hypothetical protein DMG88_23255 [Acidobacteria bacterium]|nr:MAG: hypothetical protein DMG88_23255 [Acidobacteriota bacterium]
MIVKRVLRPERLRQVPPGFNWLDHRLVSQNFISRCDHSALALYLFLVTVADAQGLSYYSDASVCRRLRMDLLQLSAARQQLVDAELVAYQKPLYQVLALDAAPLAKEENRSGLPQSAGDILRRVFQSKGGTP